MQFKKKSLEIPEYSYERLVSYSYWLLGQRDYAPSQILKKLATKSTDIEKNQKVINFLIEKNYLNEAKFIENIGYAMPARRPFRTLEDSNRWCFDYIIPALQRYKFID